MTMKNLIGYDIDDILDLVGLQRQRSFVGAFLPAVGFIALGAVVGAGVGLMLAPSSGRRLRQEARDRIDQLRERMQSEGMKKGVVSALQGQNATT